MSQNRGQSRGQGKWNRLQSYVARLHFRYKIAAYVFGVMLFACGLYTFLVWETTRQLSQQIKLAATARQEAAKMSWELHHFILTSEVLSEFKDEAFSQKVEERSAEINAQYEAELKKAVDAQEQLLARQSNIFWVWTAGFGVITAVLVFLSIVLSRRIASPMGEFQQMMEAVSRGELQGEPRDLRVSGEFQGLQGALSGMVSHLRAEKAHILAEVHAASAELESLAPHQGKERLKRLAKTLETQLK